MKPKDLSSITVSEHGRTEAIATQDALDYFNACNQHGFSPDEDPELYEKGRQLAEVPRREDYRLSKSPIPSVRRDSKQFVRFLNAHLLRGIDEQKPLVNSLSKRSLYQQFFPGHFQKIDYLTYEQFGVLYRNVVNHAKLVKDQQ